MTASAAEPTEPATTPCRPCGGAGWFSDTRTAAITHRASTVRRRCRFCRGEGVVVVVAPVIVWDGEIGEIPEWMLGE